MNTLIQDLKYATRQLLRSPGFTLVAVLTLALGIGANVALFTLADGILLRPRPGVGDADRMVWVSALESNRATNTTYADFVDFRNGTTAFSHMALVNDMSFSVTVGNDSRVHRGQMVSGDYFGMLRTPFVLGRGFSRAEDSIPGASPVVVVSHDFWQSRLAGDPGVVGRELVVNGTAFTILGVTMPGFNGADHDDQRRAIWVPVAMTQQLFPAWTDVFTSRGFRAFRAIGRLAPGATSEQADTELATIAARLVADDAENRDRRSARTYSAATGVPPGGASELGVLALASFAVAGLLLLIACANVSNLLLGRGVARRREIGVRLSLGAARSRLLRQLMTESLLLSAIATAVSVVLGTWIVDVMLKLVIPLPLETGLNWRLVAAAAGISGVTATLFGIIPAFDATRGDLTDSLKDGAPGSDNRRSRLQGGFVVAQVALSLLLLVTSGLFLRSVGKATAVDVGYDASSRVLAASFDLGLRGYSNEQSTAFVDALMERVRTMPRVEAVSTANQVPLSNRVMSTEVTVELATGTASSGSAPGNGGARPPPGDRGRYTVRANPGYTVMPAIWNVVRPAYFAAIGLGLKRGRDFSDADRVGGVPVAIVNETLARRAWGDADPLGKRISVEGAEGPYLTVVGVAADARVADASDREIRPSVYMPQAQASGWNAVALLVRTSDDVAGLPDAIRKEIEALDRYVAIERIRTLADYRRDNLAGQRQVSRILAIVGTLALLLASVGVYGVMAFAVRRRTREIGVRVALGAARSQVVLLLVRQGMRQTLLGVSIGLLLAFGATRLLSNLLFGITPTDAVTFAGVSALLGAVALLACWLPARRAASVDPMVALRTD